MTSYAASVGDTSDSTAQIFGCGGTLAANPAFKGSILMVERAGVMPAGD